MESSQDTLFSVNMQQQAMELLTSIKMMEVMLAKKKTLSELVSTGCYLSTGALRMSGLQIRQRHRNDADV